MKVVDTVEKSASHGVMTVSRVMITGNAVKATYGQLGYLEGGGICNKGTLTIEDSTRSKKIQHQ